MYYKPLLCKNYYVTSAPNKNPAPLGDIPNPYKGSSFSPIGAFGS